MDADADKPQARSLQALVRSAKWGLERDFRFLKSLYVAPSPGKVGLL